MMPTQDIRQQVATALDAVENKKAEDVTLLQLPSEASTLTDYFLICSGNNARQVQAIADEVDERLSKGLGVEPNAREGYAVAEWILLDYVDFVVHIFNTERRAYYDLERLWKSARRLTREELLHAAKKTSAAKTAVKKTATKKTTGKKTSAAQEAKEATPKKAVKPAAKKSASKKAVAKTAVKSAKKSSAKKATSKKSVKKTAPKKVATKKTANKKKRS